MIVSVSGTVGPMSRDFQGLVGSMKALLNSDLHFQLDPTVPPVKFNSEVSVKLIQNQYL